jgi:hypothetical protein
MQTKETIWVRGGQMGPRDRKTTRLVVDRTSQAPAHWIVIHPLWQLRDQNDAQDVGSKTQSGRLEEAYTLL